MKNLITENTGVSLTVLGMIIGAVVWISFIAAKTEANASALSGLAGMQADIAVIRTKVEHIERRMSARGR